MEKSRGQTTSIRTLVDNVTLSNESRERSLGPCSERITYQLLSSIWVVCCLLFNCLVKICLTYKMHLIISDDWECRWSVACFKSNKKAKKSKDKAPVEGGGDILLFLINNPHVWYPLSIQLWVALNKDFKRKTKTTINIKFYFYASLLTFSKYCDIWNLNISIDKFVEYSKQKFNYKFWAWVTIRLKAGQYPQIKINWPIQILLWSTLIS